jgi:predicted aspartyl protease
MGNVFAEITLKNSGDLSNVRHGIIPDTEVRTLTLAALVDTGASTLVINEDICRQLGLSICRNPYRFPGGWRKKRM